MKKIPKVNILHPNFFTSINLLLGLGVIFLCFGASQSGHINEKYYVLASWLIIAAMALDGLEASRQSSSQLEPGKTTTPNFILGT